MRLRYFFEAVFAFRSSDRFCGNILRRTREKQLQVPPLPAVGRNDRAWGLEGMASCENCADSLQLRRLARQKCFGFGDEVGQRHGALVAFAAGADADCVRGFFLVAEDEDVRRLLVGEVADLGVHLLVAVVGFDAEAGGFQLGFDFCGVGRDAAR